MCMQSLAADLLSTAAEVAQRQSLPSQWRFHLCQALIHAYMHQAGGTLHKWSSCANPNSFQLPIDPYTELLYQIDLYFVLARSTARIIKVKIQRWIEA